MNKHNSSRCPKFGINGAVLCSFLLYTSNKYMYAHALPRTYACARVVFHFYTNGLEPCKGPNLVSRCSKDSPVNNSVVIGETISIHYIKESGHYPTEYANLRQITVHQSRPCSDKNCMSSRGLIITLVYENMSCKSTKLPCKISSECDTRYFFSIFSLTGYEYIQNKPKKKNLDRTRLS